ncbi:5-(carboxyamino)imidazole ribonucleotide synthase [Niallia circulans]|uniref:N5-carboxyaminoimidazole ribonucleotide synthase n=1 Tax=Niallia circulans TaxID=1397 RepID=A0A553SPV7_NIACI|nr:5-(carboxyamino)imidazole ribonucleotide synthase [Niallia circulans]
MSNSVILPGQTIGIIGGGQLGRMMALAAKAQGYRIAVLDPTEDSPCGQVADYKIVDAYNSIEGIQQLAQISDVITYEFENIDAEGLDWLQTNAYVPQGSSVLEITQDRISEKQAIQQAGVKVAPFEVIENAADLEAALATLGYPAVLKTARGGYDGKGQYVIRSSNEVKEAAKLLTSGRCVLEKWIPFEKEISVIVTRGTNGESAVFPVSENIHIHNILHESIVPARISDHAKENAIAKAGIIAEHLQLVGTLAVEMFLCSNDDIYINELAPRPHNSGHYTIEACETSQFEQHIRAVCGVPLGSTKLLRPAVMVNILGEHQAPIIDKLPELQDWKVHLYGKQEPKEKRKMGHATLLRSSVEIALDEIDRSNIWSLQTEKIGG